MSHPLRISVLVLLLGVANAQDSEAVRDPVRVGQRFHFRVSPEPSTEMEIIWEVTEVTDAEVKYSVSKLAGGELLAPPTEQTWSVPAPVDEVDPAAKPPVVETVTLAGVTWDCWVVTSGDTTVWLSKTNGLSTFPSLVRRQRAGRITLELTKITTRGGAEAAKAIEGFTWLRSQAFSCAGQTHTVQVYRSEAFASALGLGAGKTDVACEFVLLPGGTFTMGSPADEAERRDTEGPQHEVKIKGFLVARTEVTQAVWEGLKNENPSSFRGGRRPVEQVSWNHARKFSRRAGLRLPSEAEWEYACRAGSTTPFVFGPTITPDHVNYDGDQPYGGSAKGVNRKQTTDVGSFAPNAFGLFDLHGNVYEWCEDTFQKTYTGAPTDGSAWVIPGSTRRVRRGGGWSKAASASRSALRSRGGRALVRPYLGFRPVRAAP